MYAGKGFLSHPTDIQFIRLPGFHLDGEGGLFESLLVSYVRRRLERDMMSNEEEESKKGFELGKEKNPKCHLMSNMHEIKLRLACALHTGTKARYETGELM